MSSGDNAERALSEITSKVLERLHWAGFLDGRRYGSTDRDYRDDYEWMNSFPYPRPSLMHSLSDTGSSLSRLAVLSTTPSSTAKPSEADVAFQLNQLAYRFMRHFDDKDFSALKTMMTSNVKVPKDEYKPEMSMDDLAFPGSEESSGDYIVKLKSAYTQCKNLDTNHHIGASFLHKPVSSSERIASYQVKIVQSRYNSGNNHDRYPARTRIDKRDTAMMEVVLYFKQAKDKKDWKIAGMAGSIKWIEYNKPKEIITSPTKPAQKRILENVLRYHRIIPPQESPAAPIRRPYRGEMVPYHGASASYAGRGALIMQPGTRGYTPNHNGEW